MFKWNYPAKTGMDKEIQTIRFKVAASIKSVKEREKGVGGILKRQM